MSNELSLGDLMAAVRGTAAAFRSVTRLQPIEGPGGKIFPATYDKGVYARERRRLEDGTTVDCVLLDSVQSSSNRAEEALKRAIEEGKITLPLIEVDFSAANERLRNPLPTLTSLDVPHRLADAILRDSLTPEGVRFSQSTYAQRWGRSMLWNATAVYELCPTALVFGMWGSPLKPGGLGAKFERAYVSEVVAVDVVGNPTDRNGKPEKRMGFRIDPVGASSKVLLKPKEDGSFEIGGKAKPSELNHSNIPFDSENVGVRCRYAEQTTVVSLGALRKLRFPIEGKDSSDVNHAGRGVLAALGLCAGVLASETGMSLRSRCHLWPEEERQWELLDRPGQEARKFRLSGDEAIALLVESVEMAKKRGLAWMEGTLRLTPSPELVELIRQSQEVQAKEKGDGEARDAQ